MVLSRFWLVLFLSSILFIFFSFLSNKKYALDDFLNGKKDDPILVSQVYLNQLPSSLKDTLLKAPENKLSQVSASGQEKTYELKNNVVKIYTGTLKTDGLLATCKNSLTDIIIPLIAYLAFFCGLMQLLIDSSAAEKLAQFSSPFFVRIFPSVPKNHESISYMTLNFAANFLGLDSAATPFGLKAMESLQKINTDKDKASDAQIMFMCLHAAGLTLLPTSIIGYRAAANAENPADVMIPCIITSFIGTLAALLIVGFKQRINFLNKVLILTLMVAISAIAGLLFYINHLDFISKTLFTTNLSSIILFGIILFIMIYSVLHEKKFIQSNTTIFDSFVTGAKEGLNTGVRIFPYVLGMLVAISLFRNSGLFELISSGLSSLFSKVGVSQDITNSLPVALLRPFSSGGSRGFLLDSMNTYGPDSFTGRLSCIFQCSAETTFYVVAVYFGSINVKNTRYTLGAMLLVDLICVFAAVFVASWFFAS